jgi:hypothetical protein
MWTLDARIEGRVAYRLADGRPATVPRGPCSVQAHEGVVGIVWAEGPREGRAVMSELEFENHLQTRAIVALS